jgi:hypothetical protein
MATPTMKTKKEDEVSEGPAVPGSVGYRPINRSGMAVDEDHGEEGEAAEDVEGEETFRAWGWDG